MKKYFFIKIIIFKFLLFSICYLSPLTDYSANNQLRLELEQSIIDSVNNKQNNKKMLIAVGLSALFSGGGHFYQGNWKKGAIYSSIELLEWIARENYLNKADEVAYKKFARENWSVAKWLHDYFDQEAYGTNIAAEFIDSGTGEFVPIWKHAHKVRLNYNGQVYDTSLSGFETTYNEICGTSSSSNYICLENISEIEGEVTAVFDHHLYEGIGKYNMYFAGWNDSKDGELGTYNGYDNIAMSPNKRFYEYKLRADHKKYNDNAGNVLSAILITHAVSMFDILLTDILKKIRIESSANYNSSSKYGVDNISFSIGWK